VVSFSSRLVQGSSIPALAADPGDEFWSADYYHAGVSGYFRTMLSQSDGVYAGGTFSSITGQPALNVARLTMSDGLITGVVPLGSGLDQMVKAMCEHNGDIIAGGSFDKSGNTTLNRVARWDGSQWHPLGDGLPGVWVAAVASYNGNVFANNQRWNGSQWTELFETDGHITAMIVHDGLLFVGGQFSQVNGQSHQNVFAWDGTQILSLADGFPYSVYSMTEGPTGVVLSGNTDYAYGQISRWDGNAWISELENTIVHDVTYFDGDLVVSALLYVGGGMFENALRSNSGESWHTIGEFSTGALAVHDGLLLAKVNAGVQPGILCPGLIGYNGASLQGVFPPSNGFAGSFQSLHAMDTALLVGGSFVIADGQEFDGAALMANGTWSAWGGRSDLDTTFPGSFRDLTAVGLDVFGIYEFVDYDVEVEVLVKLNWDGNEKYWEIVPLDTWFYGQLQKVGSDLYNNGYGGINQVDLQSGDLTLVPGLDLDSWISDTCDHQGSLVICGNFNNGQPVGSVLRYSGNTWDDLGSPVPGLSTQVVAPLDGPRLAAVTVQSGEYRVSVYDGETWSYLPGEFDGSITDLVYHRGRLFAAGNFDKVDLLSSPGISIWTGDRWAMVGSGIPGRSWGRVQDIASAGENLYLVGGFTSAGGHPSAGFAEFSGDPADFTGAPSGVEYDIPTSSRLLGRAWPNPFNPRTQVSFVVPCPRANLYWDFRHEGQPCS